MMISETESLLWEMVGALDVADATDAKKMPIVAEYAKRIAATLGTEPPYGELLRCLENDWHISASWDDLRKFWCIELTEEGVKLRDAAHGTLTANELNAELESETCRNQWQWDSGFCCSECFYTVPFVGKFVNKAFMYCPNCRRKVVK